LSLAGCLPDSKRWGSGAVEWVKSNRKEAIFLTASSS
jgi:hypothetical protein